MGLNLKKKIIRLGYAEKNVFVYPEKVILDAIKNEGLTDDAWGYKAPTCIWVYIDGEENEAIWRHIRPSMTGVEVAFYNPNELERVHYYIVEKD